MWSLVSRLFGMKSYSAALPDIVDMTTDRIRTVILERVFFLFIMRLKNNIQYKNKAKNVPC